MNISVSSNNCSAAAQVLEQNIEPMMCYKLLRYIMSTQRKALKNLKPSLMPLAAQNPNIEPSVQNN